MDINNSILSFGDYFLLTLKTSKKKFLQLFIVTFIYMAAIIIIILLCFIPIGLAISHYMPTDLFQNSYAMQSYLTSDTYIYQILALLPIIFIAYIVFVFFNMLFLCIELSAIYIITDSFINNRKRNFGSILAFAFKRAFPTLGTYALLMIIMIGISIAYSALIFVISQFNSSGFGYGYGSFWQVILYIITLCAMIYISIIYSMSIFARVKYKLSAIDSLRYSRVITKGKRGKILGNILLMALISVVILILLAFAFVYLFYYHGVVSVIIIYLIAMLIQMILNVFWAIMFINFDNVKGKDIINTEFPSVVNIKDTYFQSGEAAQDYTYNQNNAQQTNAPVQNSSTEEQHEPAPVQSSEQANIQSDDTATDGNIQHNDQPFEEPASADDKITTE